MLNTFNKTDNWFNIDSIAANITEKLKHSLPNSILHIPSRK